MKKKEWWQMNDEEWLMNTEQNNELLKQDVNWYSCYFILFFSLVNTNQSMRSNKNVFARPLIYLCLADRYHPIREKFWSSKKNYLAIKAFTSQLSKQKSLKDQWKDLEGCLNQTAFPVLILVQQFCSYGCQLSPKRSLNLTFEQSWKKVGT